MKTSDINLPPIIGVSGVARSGKDTFVAVANAILKKARSDNKGVMRAAFADKVKEDLHQLLVKKVGISAFTSYDHEKKVIRPLLVAYGMMMRGIDEDYWVNRLDMSFKLAQSTGLPMFIPDVRFANEVDYVHKNGGLVVHLSQKGLKPANETEEKHDPIVKEMSDIQLEWENVEGAKELPQDKLEKLLIKELSPVVRSTLKNLHIDAAA